MKTHIVISVLLTSALAELSADYRHLPPNHGSNGGGLNPPSEDFGPPGFGTQRQLDHVARKPPSNYGPSSSFNTRRPSNHYGPPSNRNGPPSNQYGPPSNRNGPPSNQYGPPSNLNRPLSNQYVPPARQPSNQYGPPSGTKGLGRPMGRVGQRPGTAYGQHNLSRGYGAQYSGFGGNKQYSQNRDFNNLDQNKRHLPPGGRRSYNGDDEANAEPANYNFEYAVKDDASGNDFGHRESRVGERTEGVYYVVLPDGRKQTVHYKADQNGYRPKISYEEVATERYNRGLNDGYQ